MARREKKEEVSVSFHFLVRLKDRHKKDSGYEPVSADEFDEVYKSLETAKSLNLNDKNVLDLVRAKRIAPIIKLERDNARTISGLFKGSYYGHSFENNVKGEISAQSVNLRPFFFQLYLAESGRLYIASQYLGWYGGYTQICNAVVRALPKSSSIESRSINVTSLDIANAQIKEVEVEYSKKPKSTTGKNQFGKRGTLSIQAPEGDLAFEKTVRSQLLDKKNFKKSGELRKILANMLRGDDLLDLEDDEISACRVLIRSNKKSRYVYVISGTDFATRFPLDVPLDENSGHPLYAPMKTKISALLKSQIVAKKEHV